MASSFNNSHIRIFYRNLFMSTLDENNSSNQHNNETNSSNQHNNETNSSNQHNNETNSSNQHNNENNQYNNQHNNENNQYNNQDLLQIISENISNNLLGNISMFFPIVSVENIIDNILDRELSIAIEESLNSYKYEERKENINIDIKCLDYKDIPLKNETICSICQEDFKESDKVSITDL